MKSTPVLTAALAFSLFVNFVLWARIEREARAATQVAASARSGTVQPSKAAAGSAPAKASGSIEAGAALRGVVWRKARTPEEWRKLAEELRAAGFSELDVRLLIERNLYMARRGSSSLAKLPFWQQMNGGKATQAEFEKINQDIQALRDSVLGKEVDDGMPDDPLFRAAMFGSLPDEKVKLLTKIERDYGEIYWQQRRAGGEGTDALETFEGRTRIRLLEEEKERDIAAVLTPEEFEDFERRQSRAARTVIQGVRDIEVSEAEYDALYRLQRRALESVPRTAGPEEALAYAREWAASAEDVRAVLKDDRFYSYLENTDPVYGTVAKFAKTVPTLTRDQTYQLYQLQSAAMLAVARTAGPGEQSDLANTPAGRAALAPFGAQLDTLLGPTAAAAYRRSRLGRIFAAAPPEGP